MHNWCEEADWSPFQGPRCRACALRTRIGKVSVNRHRSSWWIYYREHGKPIRGRLGADRNVAQRLAAEINAQLTCAAPTMLAFTPISFSALVVLEDHQQVLRSIDATVSRYRTALAHLTAFVERSGRSAQSHQVDAAAFVGHLRTLEGAPNGNAKRLPARIRRAVWGRPNGLRDCRTRLSRQADRRRWETPSLYDGPAIPTSSPHRLWPRLRQAQRVRAFDWRARPPRRRAPRCGSKRCEKWRRLLSSPPLTGGFKRDDAKTGSNSVAISPKRM